MAKITVSIDWEDGCEDSGDSFTINTSAEDGVHITPLNLKRTIIEILKARGAQAE